MISADSLLLMLKYVSVILRKCDFKKLERTVYYWMWLPCKTITTDAVYNSKNTSTADITWVLRRPKFGK